MTTTHSPMRVGVEISSVPLVTGHRIVGVFGQVVDVDEEQPEAPPPHLTPRQVEVLRLLQRGASTGQIARELRRSENLLEGARLAKLCIRIERSIAVVLHRHRRTVSS